MRIKVTFQDGTVAWVEKSQFGDYKVRAPTWVPADYELLGRGDTVEEAIEDASDKHGGIEDVEAE